MNGIQTMDPNALPLIVNEFTTARSDRFFDASEPYGCKTFVHGILLDPPEHSEAYTTQEGGVTETSVPSYEQVRLAEAFECVLKGEDTERMTLTSYLHNCGHALSRHRNGISVVGISFPGTAQRIAEAADTEVDPDTPRLDTSLISAWFIPARDADFIRICPFVQTSSSLSITDSIDLAKNARENTLGDAANPARVVWDGYLCDRTQIN